MAFAVALGLAVFAQGVDTERAGAGPAGHTDRDGNPLAAEAVARVGSMRIIHPPFPMHVEYSPDGRLLASAGGGWLRLWDARTARLIRGIQLSRPGHTVAGTYWEDGCFSANGKTVVVLEGQSCLWFDIGSGTELRRVKLQFSPKDQAVLGPGGRTLAAIDTNPGKDLVLLDLPSGEKRFLRGGGPVEVRPLIFSRDGKTLAALETTGQSRVIRFLDTGAGRDLGSFEAGRDLPLLAFSPDGTRLLDWQARTLCVRAVPSGRVLYRVSPPAEDGFVTAGFTPDGRFLVVGLAGSDACLAYIEPASGKELRRVPTGLPHSPLSVPGFAFSPDGKSLAWPFGPFILRWDIDARQWRAGSPESELDSSFPLRFSDDGKSLWIRHDRCIALVDWQSGREIRRLPRAGWKEFLALSPDASRAAARTPAGKLAIWDTATGEAIRTFAASDIFLALPAYTADGKGLCVLDSTQTIRNLDVATGEELFAFPTGCNEVTRLVASPDGRLLAGIDNSGYPSSPARVSVWDLARRREACRFHTSGPGLFQSLAFTPNGQVLAAFESISRKSGESVGAVRLWEMTNGREKQAITGLADGYGTIAFAPDGRQLAVAQTKDAVRLWEVATGGQRLSFASGGGGAIVFSADGGWMATYSFAEGCLVWDVAGRHKRSPSIGPFASEDAARIWNALQDQNASAAFAAMRELRARAAPAVAFLNDHVRPVSVPDKDEIRRLLRGLDAEVFGAREKASRDLEAVADRARPLLREVLTEPVSAEVKRRVEHVLESADRLTPELLRQMRAVEVLEHLGTPEARELLARLAGGADGALQTREAQAALARLKARRS
jgi:WD40 repeat protein